MAKFFMGVEETAEEDPSKWEKNVKLRPGRLGLGADPNKGKRNPQTIQERRIAGMIRKEQRDSDDSDDESRANIGKNK